MKAAEGGSFDPETIELMRTALDEAWMALPPDTRAGLSKAFLAEGILRAAAQGERNPVRLRACALARIAVATEVARKATVPGA
jgi:hypothetical protein